MKIKLDLIGSTLPSGGTDERARRRSHIAEKDAALEDKRATVRAVGFNAADRTVVAESSNGLGQAWPLAAAP